MRLQAVLGDITELNVDVIVNSCNNQMHLGYSEISRSIQEITEGRIQQALLHDPNLRTSSTAGDCLRNERRFVTLSMDLSFGNASVREEMSRDAHLEEEIRNFGKSYKNLS